MTSIGAYTALDSLAWPDHYLPSVFYYDMIGRQIGSGEDEFIFPLSFSGFDNNRLIACWIVYSLDAGLETE